MLSKPAKPEPKPFWGFDASGSAFRSSVRVDNTVTTFLRDMCRLVREKFMAPADVELVLRSQPHWVRSAFPNAYLWSDRLKPWDWFSAYSGTPAEETLKRAAPDHLSDPEAYRQWLEDAERFHGGPCRFAALQREILSVFGTDLEPPTLEEPCRVHAPKKPHSSEPA